MRDYYAVLVTSGPRSVVLDIDYDLQDVPDPLCFLHGRGSEVKLASAFRFTALSGKILEDLIPNNLGWFIMSPRAVKAFAAGYNQADINYVSLKSNPTVRTAMPGLEDYFVVGFRRVVFALDKEKSDVRWSQTAPSRLATAIYRGVLLPEALSDDCEVFMLGEWPVTPLVSSRLTDYICKSKLSGCSLQRFAS